MDKPPSLLSFVIFVFCVAAFLFAVLSSSNILEKSSNADAATPTNPNIISKENNVVVFEKEPSVKEISAVCTSIKNIVFAESGSVYLICENFVH